METTLYKVTLQLQHLHFDHLPGAPVLLKGVQLLVEHAAAPWTELVPALFPSAPVLRELFQAIRLPKPAFDADACAALALQHAYLQVFQRALQEEQAAFEAQFELNGRIHEQQRQKLSLSVETLQECELRAAELDFPNLHDHPFVKQLEGVTADWFRMRLFRTARGAYEAANVARRISYQLYPQLLEILTEYAAFYAPLTEYLQLLDDPGTRALRTYRAALMKLPAQPIFPETFALRDVYVELNATVLTRSHQTHPRKSPEHVAPYVKGPTVQLMQTVLDQLEDRERVVFIQAEPGKGKSVFCQMLAARIAVERPDWIPVLISLRNERLAAEQPLKEFFQAYLQRYFTLTKGWLPAHRFLFMLDGLDDLTWPADSGYALKAFFEQLADFQQTAAGETRRGHKLIVTGRPLRLQELEAELPANFLWLQIEPLENPQLFTWLRNWAKLFGETTAETLRAFLEQGNVFEEAEADTPNTLKRLTREPLLLYLLSAMHRDGAFAQAPPVAALPRSEIYDRVVSWACGDARKYHTAPRHHRLLEKSGVRPSELRRLLQEIALCVWHSRQEIPPLAYITERLKDVMPEQLKKLRAAGFEGVHNAFVSCSLEAAEGAPGSVKFLHKSFGEYLAAERIVEILKHLGHPKEDRMHKEIVHRFYATFGVALLTDEIRDFIITILAETLTAAELQQMTDRLGQLYIYYSDGRWMEEGIVKSQWETLKRYGVRLGLFPFEAQAGINLFALLCLLHQHSDASFEICGRAADGTFDPNRFRKLIGFGEMIGTFGLFRRVNHLLQKVSLQGANLVCLNLRRANLQAANLQGAILRDANLRAANLQAANLQGADLRMASLQDANLQAADMRGANLEEADLRDANLQDANLAGANLLCADLRNVDLQGACLQQAVLYGANLRDAILQDADVSGAIISKQHLAQYQPLFSPAQIAQLNVVQD